MLFYVLSCLGESGLNQHQTFWNLEGSQVIYKEANQNFHISQLADLIEFWYLNYKIIALYTKSVNLLL